MKKLSLDAARTGKATLITGASSGLGKELAALFSSHGHVILSGRDRNKLEATRLLCKDPANTTLVCGDLRNSDTLDRLQSFAHLYEIHYLVCSSGVYHSSRVRELFEMDVLNVLNSNLTATINLVTRIYKQMADRSMGSILHINSIAGKNIDSIEPIYAASKHGMAAFLKALRFEARARSVRVLDVFPGAIQTEMNTGRVGWAGMMSVKEVAQAIYAVATFELATAQIEELHLGRFPA